MPNCYDGFTKLAKFGPAAFSGTSHVLSQPHETAQERVTDNGITIYGDSSTYNRLSAVAKAYHDIWRDKGGVVNIPEKDWMEINVKTGNRCQIPKLTDKAICIYLGKEWPVAVANLHGVRNRIGRNSR